MNSTQLSVLILDGKNYNRWCVQTRGLFDYHEFWDVDESGVFALVDNATETQRVADRDQKKKDKKVLYLIHQGMNDEKFEHIEGAASEVWTILSTNYKGDDKIKRVRLRTLRRQSLQKKCVKSGGFNMAVIDNRHKFQYNTSFH